MAIIIVAPEAPQTPPKPPTVSVTPSRATADPLDRKFIELVGQQAGEPVALWTTIQEIVQGEHPPGRSERRRLIGRVLCAGHAPL
jgi:hypothetical protein